MLFPSLTTQADCSDTTSSFTLPHILSVHDTSSFPYNITQGGLSSASLPWLYMIVLAFLPMHLLYVMRRCLLMQVGAVQDIPFSLHLITWTVRDSSEQSSLPPPLLPLRLLLLLLP